MEIKKETEINMAALAGKGLGEADQIMGVVWCALRVLGKRYNTSLLYFML